MAIEISEKIRLYGKEALEERLNVATIAGRNAIPLNERYNGMITTVREEGKRYELLYKGDFEALSEVEKNSFLGDDNNWEEASAGYAFTDKDKAINIEDLEIEDWNDIIDSGLYMGNNKANAPMASDVVHAWRYVQTIKHNEDFGMQIAWDFAGVSMWVRIRNSGYWNDWKRIVVQGDSMTITTEGWQKGKPLIYKAIVDDDIGIQEWEMARIYATPHNEGYYNHEVSPLNYVALRHRFLKDDTEGSEEKGDIEAGELSVLKIRNDVPLKILKLGASDYEYQGVIVDFLVVGENEHGDMTERVPQKGIYASGEIRSPFLRGDHSVTIGSTDGHGGFGNPALLFEWLHTVGDSDAKIFLAEGSTSPGGGKLIYRANGGHVFEGSITASGDITAFSDKRLKANIKPIAKALDKIKKIEGVSYTRKDQADKNKKHIGVIAQDLLQVVPEVVQVPDKPEGMHSVDYSKLTALLIEGIKEQQKEIELLKREINLMKGGE